MSKKTAAEAFKLRKRYAHAFDVPIDEIEEHEYPNGEVEIWYGELPRWSTGELEPRSK